MKNLKYTLVIILSAVLTLMPLIAAALTIYFYLKYKAEWIIPVGVIGGAIGWFLNQPVRELRVKYRREVEYDEYGLSKTKGKYEYLSKAERDLIDLQKTADMERLVNSTALKKMTKKGPEDPMRELDEMIGLDPVKQTIKEMVARMEFESEENKKKKKKDRVNMALSGRHMAFTGSPGTGKAQPLYSKVLTPNGFVQMGDIKVGDAVVAANGDLATVLGVFPQGVKKIWELVLKDGSRCRCSDEHLWQIKTRQDLIENTCRIVELKDIFQILRGQDGLLNCAVPVVRDKEIKDEFIQFIEYVGEEECQCIYIDHPSHLYITDDYIVTHNTTVARIMTSFLYKYGYIKENKCIEIDGNFLKAGTESAIKTELILRHAYGGVLFIDEAYSLMDSSDNSGEQVIATLIKQMEDQRGKFILIIAGYTNEMKRLIDANPGFESRIKEYLHFPDYNAIEMREIFCYMARKHNFAVNANALDHYDAIVARERKSRSFGNGRTARNILDKVIDKHTLNLATGILPPDDRYRLCSQDFQNIKLGGIGFEKTW